MRSLAKASKSTSRKGQRGQGMTEYIVIVALIAIGSIAVVSIFGDNIRALFGNSATALAGEAGTLEANAVSDNQKDLTDFSEDEP